MRQRLSGQADRDAPAVSICIPTWRSQAFIARTLDFALGQTYPRTRVLVSVDQCNDDTAETCRAYARGDARVQVFVQPGRLGWARNVNFLLDRVETELFFLYFHDDVIVPQYTERMVRALQRRPDAASVHCDMGHFGGSDHVSVGVEYPAALARRLGWFLVAPDRGSPLRSLTRSTALASGLRLPVTAVDGLWANEPYLLRLLAAGPALHLPETLYFRWDKRTGGLTDGWRQLPLEQVYAGYRDNVSSFLAILDAAAVSDGEREALRFCLYAYVMLRARMVERERGAAAPRDAQDVHAAFAAMRVPDCLGLLGTDVEAWALRLYDQLESTGAKVA
jgi:glycosyltransferase involved in cell wall biosynthesis